jgi:hypothetical protein
MLSVTLFKGRGFMVGPEARRDVNMAGVAWRVASAGRRLGELNGDMGVFGE